MFTLPPHMNIEEQLEKLREEYRQARKENNTTRMKTIELKGKCLKLSLRPDPFKEIEKIFIGTDKGS